MIWGFATKAFNSFLMYSASRNLYRRKRRRTWPLPLWTYYLAHPYSPCKPSVRSLFAGESLFGGELINMYTKVSRFKGYNEVVAMFLWCNVSKSSDFCHRSALPCSQEFEALQAVAKLSGSPKWRSLKRSTCTIQADLGGDEEKNQQYIFEMCSPGRSLRSPYILRSSIIRCIGTYDRLDS